MAEAHLAAAFEQFDRLPLAEQAEITLTIFAEHRDIVDPAVEHIGPRRDDELSVIGPLMRVSSFLAPAGTDYIRRMLAIVPPAYWKDNSKLLLVGTAFQTLIWVWSLSTNILPSTALFVCEELLALAMHHRNAKLEREVRHAQASIAAVIGGNGGDSDTPRYVPVLRHLVGANDAALLAPFLLSIRAPALALPTMDPDLLDECLENYITSDPSYRLFCSRPSTSPSPSREMLTVDHAAGIDAPRFLPENLCHCTPIVEPLYSIPGMQSFTAVTMTLKMPIPGSVYCRCCPFFVTHTAIFTSPPIYLYRRTLLMGGAIAPGEDVQITLRVTGSPGKGSGVLMASVNKVEAVRPMPSISVLERISLVLEEDGTIMLYVTRPDTSMSSLGIMAMANFTTKCYHAPMVNCTVLFRNAPTDIVRDSATVVHLLHTLEGPLDFEDDIYADIDDD